MGKLVGNRLLAVLVAGLLGTWSAWSNADASARRDRPGFEVRTNADNPSIKKNSVVIRYEGAIAFPMAENLAAIWAELRGSFDTVVLDLDSLGGELDHTEKVIEVLKAIRADATLKTLVNHGQRCLSACVAVFVQGEERVAGADTSWMFHGACPAHTNVPSPEATRRFLDLLRSRGASEEFICVLLQQGRVTEPGYFWLSGYELFHVHDAKIITRLLDAWQPQAPGWVPADPQIRPR